VSTEGRRISPDDLLLIDDVAREYRIGQKRIRQLVRSGQLRHLPVGRKVLIPRWVVLEWIRENLTAAPHPS
jgi:excisionase family DNA binding protein